MTWQETAARKRAERDAKIPDEWRIPTELLPSADVTNVQSFPTASGMFTDDELALTELTASEAVERVASGELTAEELLRAVCKRAAVAQQLCNCVTEILFEEALVRAKELDAHFKATGKTVGPLHGLPISLKDQFDVAGVASTLGYVSYIDRPLAAEDATLVELLKAAGAIIYIKTNVPTTLMMGESVNNVFGRTLNPRNRQLTTGGSSGGESCLLTFRGSLLGIGTDIGGSIRHPASYTGLYALRPSHGRVSYQKATNTLVGQEAVRSTAGPMAHSPEDVALFMKSYLAQEPWLHDPEVLPIPWRDFQLPSKLCFGISVHDGYVTASPPLQRAVAITRARLEAAGHRVIEFVPVENKEAATIVRKMWEADGGEEVRRDADASGEPLPPTVENWYGRSNTSLRPMTVTETWANQTARSRLASRFLKRWQNTASETGTGRPIDALIMPSTPFPAIRHDGGYPWQYGVMQPLLDLTTGVFPVTQVDQEKDIVPANWVPLSDKDREVMDYYGSPQNHENALIGLTVIGRRLEEEKITAILAMLRDLAK